MQKEPGSFKGNRALLNIVADFARVLAAIVEATFLKVCPQPIRKTEIFVRF